MKHDEFVETAAEAGQWLEHNWPTVARIAAGVVAVALLVLAFVWYGNHNRARAGELLAQGMERYRQAEAAGFTDPAEVEGALALFEQAARRSSGSPAGLSARYYRGAALLRLGRLDESIEVLEKLAGADPTPTLRASARVLLADALAARGDTERAIALLEEVAADPDSAFPPDQALLRVARLHQDGGNLVEAQQVWERITREYPQSAGAAEAQRLLVAP